jgi:gas vesicle protein
MKFFVGLLLGLGLGVIVGLLVAPQSGEETRAFLNEQGIRLRTGELNEDLRTRAREALAQGRDLYTRTKDDLTTRYTDARAGTL